MVALVGAVAQPVQVTVPGQQVGQPYGGALIAFVGAKARQYAGSPYRRRS
jgi:hypothetical protein